MGTVAFHLWRQQILCERRDDCSREEIRGEHGKDNRLGEWHKEIFRDTGEKEDRDKNDANAKGRDEGRHRNLCRAIKDAFLDRPPSAMLR